MELNIYWHKLHHIWLGYDHHYSILEISLNTCHLFLPSHWRFLLLFLGLTHSFIHLIRFVQVLSYEAKFINAESHEILTTNISCFIYRLHTANIVLGRLSLEDRLSHAALIRSEVVPSMTHLRNPPIKRIWILDYTNTVASDKHLKLGSRVVNLPPHSGVVCMRGYLVRVCEFHFPP